MIKLSGILFHLRSSHSSKRKKPFGKVCIHHFSIINGLNSRTNRILQLWVAISRGEWKLNSKPHVAITSKYYAAKHCEVHNEYLISTTVSFLYPLLVFVWSPGSISVEQMINIARVRDRLYIRILFYLKSEKDSVKNSYNSSNHSLLLQYERNTFTGNNSDLNREHTEANNDNTTEVNSRIFPIYNMGKNNIELCKHILLKSQLLQFPSKSHSIFVTSRSLLTKCNRNFRYI